MCQALRSSFRSDWNIRDLFSHWLWWCMALVPVLGKLRQKDGEFSPYWKVDSAKQNRKGVSQQRSHDLEDWAAYARMPVWDLNEQKLTLIHSAWFSKTQGLPYHFYLCFTYAMYKYTSGLNACPCTTELGVISILVTFSSSLLAPHTLFEDRLSPWI